MVIMILLLSMVILQTFGLPDPSCLVNERNSNKTVPCQFPFELEGKNFSGCTRHKDGENKLWCSTKLDDDGAHIPKGGFWGYCEPTCKVDSAQIILDNAKIIDDFVDAHLEPDDGSSDSLRTETDFKNLIGSNCDCINYKVCAWSKRLTDLVRKLPSKHPTRTRAVRQMRRAICDAKNFGLRCCEDTSSDPPTAPRDSNPDTSLPTPDSSDIKNLGNWIPNPKKGECGKRLTSESIIGGNVTKPGEFPYMALLQYERGDKNYYTCGGSVINRRYVITAAHCTETNLGNPKHVILGEHVIGPNPDCNKGFCAPKIQTIKVEKFINHPMWDPQNFKAGYDISLLRLESPIYMGEKSDVSPVCLPLEETDPGVKEELVGKKGFVTGWGKVSNNRAFNSRNFREFGAGVRTLQKVDLPIVNKEKCLDIYKTYDGDKQICAGGGYGKDSCGGDSGGPLSYRKFISKPWYLFGIVSFGPDPCALKQPAVYTRVSFFTDWIIENLEE